VGKIISAIVGTIDVVRRRGETAEAPAGLAAVPHSEMTAIRELADDQSAPCVILLDNLDRARPEDLSATFALIDRSAQSPVLLVATSTTLPGRTGVEPVQDLARESERLGHGRKLDLAPLDNQQIAEALAGAFNSTIPRDWVEWMGAETGGVPGALWELVGVLAGSGELRRHGRAWVLEGLAPKRGEHRLESVLETKTLEGEDAGDDQRLLAIASLEGPLFRASVIAEVAGVDELEVEDRLARLCRSGLLQYRGTTGSGDEVTSLYAFAPGVVPGFELPPDEIDDLRQRTRETVARLDV
jgi:hypothetical protein